MMKMLKPAKDGLKVFNPATGLHLNANGEEISISSYWHRMIKCGDVVEVKPAPAPSPKQDQEKKIQSNKK